jgi:hypothetical protein
MLNILYTVAKDRNGNLVKANDSEKGHVYFCPVCSSDLILRKSGNTGKGSKRPHFAHKALTPNCTPETALHYAFKNLVADKIKKQIESNIPLPLGWNCRYCGEKHTGNLLKKITDVKVEHSLTVCKPDIALLDSENKVFAVIEVVVTHKPEESTVQFYNDNDIILIQINLTSDLDIDCLDSKLSNPDIVSTCFNPICKTCGSYVQKKIMTIIDSPCWKCDSNMKVVTISSSNGGLVRNGSNNLGPGGFTEEEIAFARSKGVILKEQYSRTVNDIYVANTCGKCGAFVGEHYLFTDYIAPAGYGDIPSQRFELGYYCEHCDNLNYRVENDQDEVLPDQ